MGERRAVIIFQIPDRGFCCDLDIPLYITADELIDALDEAYGLGIGNSHPREHYLRAEQPIALIKGKKTLEEIGLHHGSIVIGRVLPCFCVEKIPGLKKKL